MRNEFSSIRHSHQLRLQPQRQLQSEWSSCRYRMLAHRMRRPARQTQAHLLVASPQFLRSSAIFLRERWLPLGRMTCCWCRSEVRQMLPGMGRGLLVTGDSTSDLPVASAARRRAVAIGSAAGLEIGCQGYSRVVAEAGAGSGIDSSRAASVESGLGPRSASTSNSEALTDGIGDGGGCIGKDAGLCSGIWGAERRLVSMVVTGRAGGCAAGVALAGFAASVFRSRPRATRNVPLDCSTLMGLVRTRLAPIRNAFATPACPSTTATASDD